MAKTGWMGLDKGSDVGFERPKETIKFSSPSMNWLFGPSFEGLARGMTAVLWGAPKAGKSVFLYDAIAQVHRNSATARVILFDTEFRTNLQFGEGITKDIDPERLLIKQTNEPSAIFDFIEKDVLAAVDNNMDIPLICIDSISSIRGLKSLNADTVSQHLIGDQALSLQNGFQRIIPVLRRKKIALLCTSQARAEMDQIQQRMHKTIKMSLSWGVRHLLDYFIQVTQVEASAGKVFDQSRTDSNDNPLQIGNKIRCLMNESSGGGRGRTAEVTLSYEKGFIKIGEEVTNLALNLGIIHKPEGGNSLVWRDIKHRGFDAFADFLEINAEVRNEIVSEIMHKTKGQE